MKREVPDWKAIHSIADLPPRDIRCFCTDTQGRVIITHFWRTDPPDYWLKHYVAWMYEYVPEPYVRPAPLFAPFKWQTSPLCTD